MRNEYNASRSSLATSYSCSSAYCCPANYEEEEELGIGDVFFFQSRPAGRLARATLFVTKKSCETRS